MATAIQLATAYVSLVVSTKGLGKDVESQLRAFDAAADKTGQSAGKKLIAGFNKAKLDTAQQQAQLKKLGDAATRASATVAKAKEGEAKATRDVEIAQKRYEEVVTKGNAVIARSHEGVAKAQRDYNAAVGEYGEGSKQALDAQGRLQVAQGKYAEALATNGDKSARALAAEDKLTEARKKAEAAAHEVKAATDAEANALDDLKKSADKAGDSATSFGGKLKNGLKNLGEKANPFAALKRYAESDGDGAGKVFAGRAVRGINTISSVAHPFKTLRSYAESEGDGAGKRFAGKAVSGIDKIKSLNPFKPLNKTADVEGESSGKRFMGKVSDSVKKAGSGVSSLLGGIFKGGLVGIVGTVAGLGGAALKKGYDRYNAIDTAQAKLRGLGNDAKTVDAAMSDAMDSVKGTAFGLGDAATVAASAMSAGIRPGEALNKHLKTTANLAAAAGIGMDEMGSLMNKAATQVNGVQNDVIGQLADKGLPIYQKLAEEMGVTSGEVFKLASQGKVDFATFSAAASAAAGTVAEEMGTTLPAKFSNFNAALGRAGEKFLKGFLPGLGDGITGATAMIDKLGPAAEVMGKAVADGFNYATSWIKTNVAPVISDVVSTVQTIWNDKLVPLFKSEAVGNAARKVQGVFEGIVTLFRDKVGPIVMTVWETVTGAFESQGPKVEGIISKLGDVFKSAGDVFQAVGDRLVDVWNFVAPTVIPLIQGLVSTVVDVFGGLYTAISGVLDLIVGVLTGDWTKAKDGVIKIVTGLKDALGSIFGLLYDTIKNIMGRVGSWLSGKWDEIKSFTSRKVGEMKDGTIKFFKGMYDGAVEWVGNLVKGVSEKVESIKKSVLDVFGSMWEGADKAFRVGVETVGKAMEGLKEAAKAPVRFVVNTVFNDGIIAGVNKLASKVGLGNVLPEISLPRGFARGGILPGTSRASQGDDQLIMARRGEGITVSEAIDPYERARLLALNKATLSGKSPETFRQEWSGAHGYATGGVVKPVNARSSGWNGGRYRSGKWHGGLDFPIGKGNPVRAMWPGTVTKAQHLTTSYGKHIKMNHGGGVETLYAHMSQLLAGVGKVLNAGSILGRSGSTGNSSGPHLHLEVRRNGRQVDPSPYLSGATTMTGGDVPSLGEKAMALFQKAGQSVIDFVGAPLKMFNDFVQTGLDKLANVPSAGVFTDIVKKMPGMVVGGIKDWFAGKMGIPKFAAGGLHRTGGPAVVGERGPELAWLPKNTFISNNAEARAALGVGSVTQHVSVSVPREAFADIETFLRFIRQLGLRAQQT